MKGNTNNRDDDDDNNNNDAKEDEEQLVLKYVFYKCDPIIRQLCESIQRTIPIITSFWNQTRTTTTCDSSNKNSSTTTTNKTIEQQCIELLHKISNILNELECQICFLLSLSSSSIQSDLPTYDNDTKTTTTTTTTTKMNTHNNNANSDVVENDWVLPSTTTTTTTTATTTCSRSKGILSRQQHQQLDPNDTTDTNRYKTRMIRKALLTLLDYIMIPIMTIIRSFHNNNNNNNTDHPISNTTTQQQQQQQQQSNRQNQIIQSLQYKCMIGACRIVQILILQQQQLTFDDDDDMNNNNINNQNKNHTVTATTAITIHKKLVTYINACIIALPTGTMIQQQQLTTNTNEEYLHHILVTLQILIRSIHKLQSSTTTNILLPVLIIPTPYMIRIIDTCIAIIEPPSTSSTSTSSSFTSTAVATDTNEPISVQLQLIALDTLQCLLIESITMNTNTSMIASTKTSNNNNNNHDNDHDHDQYTILLYSIFPGMYAGLFRRILYSIPYINTNTTKHRIVQQCITIIIFILEYCCNNNNNNNDNHHNSNNNRNNKINLHQNRINNKSFMKQQSSIHSVFDQLKELSIQATNQVSSESLIIPSIDTNNNNHKNQNQTNNNNNNKRQQFIEQIRQRLPITMIILIKSLCKVRSTKIRYQMILFHRMMLLNTFHIWNNHINSNTNNDTNNNISENANNTSSSLIFTSFESVLILTNDNDSSIATQAQKMIQELIQQQLSINEPNRTIFTSNLGSRIIELIEKLPSLVQSTQHDDEIQYTLQLLIGYMHHIPKKVYLQSSTLILESTLHQSIQHTFVSLFDIHFEVHDPYQLGTIVLNFIHDPKEKQKSFQQYNNSNKQYVSESMLPLIVSFIQIYGSVIGPKNVTIFVDACIANMYQTCIALIEQEHCWNKRASSNTIQTHHRELQWIHESIGTIKLLQNLLIGGFLNQNKLSLRTKSIQRYLIPLLKSILPVITSYPLWDLPMNHYMKNESSNEKNPNQQNENISALTLSIFRGNVAMTCTLLEFIQTTLQILIDLNVPVLPELNHILLYPIFDKLGEQNVGSIREVAYNVLQTLVKYNKQYMNNTISFIVNHIESCLIQPMLLRLRIPGGRSLQPNTPIDYDIICVLDCATTIIRIVTESFVQRYDTTKYSNNESELLSPEPILMIVSTIEELTMQLTKRFDYASTIVSYDVTTCLRYVQLFDTAIGLLCHTYRRYGSGLSKPKSYSDSLDDDNDEPWFQLLEPYKKDNDDEGKLSPKEGFQKHWIEKDKQLLKANEINGNNSTLPKMDISNINRDIRFCSFILWRLGYLLSHSNSSVQHDTCTSTIHCFEWFGIITSNPIYSNNSNTDTSTNSIDESSTKQSTNQNPQTAILRQIHTTWPVIIVHIKRLCESVITNHDHISNKSSITMSSLLISSSSTTSSLHDQNNSNHSTNLGQERLYLSKLLQLTTCMIVNSNDFMYSRFRTILWPCCYNKLLQYYSSSSSNNNTNHTFDDARNDIQQSYPKPKLLTKSDETLLYTLLESLRHIFQYKPMSKILSSSHDYIPLIGQYIIKIIFYNYNTNELLCTVGMDVLRNMIYMNADALYRPIYQLSSHRHERMTCPLWIDQGTTTTATPKSTDNNTDHQETTTTKIYNNLNSKPSNNKVQVLADELFDLICTLPEQPLY